MSALWWGNVTIFLMVAVVLMRRWPGAATFLLISKVAPGVVVLYYAGARRWRAVGSALMITIGLVVVSFVLAPDLWVQWVSLLARSSESHMAGASPPLNLGPIWIRACLAGALVIWGGATNRPWTLVLGSLLALPGIWPTSIIFVLAIPKLLRRHEERDLDGTVRRFSLRRALAGLRSPIAG
jgi:hypothetical protein